MPATKTAPESPEWLTVHAAARLLGVTPRQVQRREQAGNIEKRFGPRTGSAGAPVLYSREDVLALKAGKPNVHARPVTNSEPILLPSKSGEMGNERARNAQNPGNALARIPPPGSVADLAMIFERAREYAKPTPRPWLTIDEAVEFSGLPRAYLLTKAREGVAWAKDVSDGGTRAHWRFSRAGLETAL